MNPQIQHPAYTIPLWTDGRTTLPERLFDPRIGVLYFEAAVS
jgi:hypothetical protein